MPTAAGVAADRPRTAGEVLARVNALGPVLHARGRHRTAPAHAQVEQRLTNPADRRYAALLP